MSDVIKKPETVPEKIEYFDKLTNQNIEKKVADKKKQDLSAQENADPESNKDHSEAEITEDEGLLLLKNRLFAVHSVYNEKNHSTVLMMSRR